MDKNHIIIAHSNQHFLEGIVAEVLTREYDISKQFTHGVKALRYILRERPKIAVLQSKFEDISACEIIKEARARELETKFIIVFSKTEQKQFLMASKMDIAGCIYDGEVLDNMLVCLNKVLDGEVFVSRGMKISDRSDSSVNLLASLSNTEMKVITLVSVYKKSSKISEKLNISIRTIEKHRSNIIKKLNINSKIESLPSWVDKHRDMIQSMALQSLSFQ